MFYIEHKRQRQQTSIIILGMGQQRRKMSEAENVKTVRGDRSERMVLADDRRWSHAARGASALDSAALTTPQQPVKRQRDSP